MTQRDQSLSMYKKQLEIGDIQKAYRTIMQFVQKLRTHLCTAHQEYASSHLYQGYMDITCFSFTPPELQDRSLKIGIVFNHLQFRFEIWLVGRNKKIQHSFLEAMKRAGFQTDPLCPMNHHSITDQVLLPEPDFIYPEKMMTEIEYRAIAFIQQIIDFLNKHGL